MCIVLLARCHPATWFVPRLCCVAVPYAFPRSFCCGHLSKVPDDLWFTAVPTTILASASCARGELLVGHVWAGLQSWGSFPEAATSLSSALPTYLPLESPGGLLGQVFLGAWASASPAKETPRLWSLFSSSSSWLLGPALGGSPPKSATYSLCDFG